jgi:putative two-component system response regulator
MNQTPNRPLRILAVDDEPAILDLYRRVLSSNEQADTPNAAMKALAAKLFDDRHHVPAAVPYTLTLCQQGEEAVEAVASACRRDEPFCVAFIDVRMPPGQGGIWAAEQIRALDPDIHIVIVTAYADVDAQEIARRVQPADKFLYVQKPFHSQEIRQFASALSTKWLAERELRRINATLEAQVEERTSQIAETRDVTVFALAKLAESRDPETGEHLERLRSYCQIIGEQLGEDSPYQNEIDKWFLNDFYRSAPLHDIGKVGIPDMILLKPGRLTTSEFEIMKQHTIIGAEALEQTARHTGSGGFLSMAAQIARYHHERFDGTGYPYGLKGADIPLPARIVAIADVYDALTTVRVYKAAFTPEIARSMIDEQESKHFDPVVVEAFHARYEQILEIGGFTDDRRLTLTPELVSSDARR